MADKEKRFLGRGYKIPDGHAIYIGNVPGAKQVCLFESRNGGNEIIPLAYFKDHDKARKALEWLDLLWSVPNYENKI